MKHQSVLLLGGGGFLGGALARYLWSKGWLVHIVSRSLAGTERTNLFFHQGHMEDKSLIESLLPECDTVIHLASGTIPGSSAGKPVVEADMNIVPTLKFLDIFRHCGNQRLIFLHPWRFFYGV